MVRVGFLVPSELTSLGGPPSILLSSHSNIQTILKRVVDALNPVGKAVYLFLKSNFLLGKVAFLLGKAVFLICKAILLIRNAIFLICQIHFSSLKNRISE